jgi:hypothetical protein
MIDDAAALGYGEYRTHIALMDQVAGTYAFNDGALMKSVPHLFFLLSSVLPTRITYSLGRNPHQFKFPDSFLVLF